MSSILATLLEKMLDLELEMPDIDDMEKDVRVKMQRVLMKSMFKMEELAIQRAPHDQGFLRQNIFVTPKILSNSFVLKSAAPYSEDLEYGNTPRFVKIDVLLEWIERKGIRTTPDGQWAFAKYVQTKIMREGVNAQPYMRPAYYEVKDKWVDVFKKQEFGSSV
jgi:hypothetical protein